MSGYIYEDLPEVDPVAKVWEAEFAKDVSAMDELAEILIPSLTRDIRFRDCRWQPRDTEALPQRGDKCLALLDENNRVWVVCWWPF